MMEGVVLYGSGKPAQLNGYSSGGKTGTAQKIDPATHLYSKTMHIASFAGIAPVNNPVIAVAVVIDNPKGGSYYGTAVSAPVFAEVAQQVLEYLAVPHDIELRPASAFQARKAGGRRRRCRERRATSMPSTTRSTICRPTIRCVRRQLRLRRRPSLSRVSRKPAPSKRAHPQTPSPPHRKRRRQPQSSFPTERPSAFLRSSVCRCARSSSRPQPPALKSRSAAAASCANKLPPPAPWLRPERRSSFAAGGRAFLTPVSLL